MSDPTPPPPPPPSPDPYEAAEPTAPPPPPRPEVLSPPPVVQYDNVPSTYGYPGPYTGPEPDQNAKTMGMLCHLLALAGYVIPFGNLIGPLILWQVKKGEHPFIDDQGKESLNYQITVSIAFAVGLLTLCIGIGFIVLPLIAVAGVVFLVLAAIKAGQGEPYRYPFTLRLVK